MSDARAVHPLECGGRNFVEEDMAMMVKQRRERPLRLNTLVTRVLSEQKPQLVVKFQVAPLANGEAGPSGPEALEALDQAFHNQFKTYRVAGSKLVSHSVAQDGAEAAIDALKVEQQPVRPAKRAGRGVSIPFEILPRRARTDLHADVALQRLEERLEEPQSERALVCGVPAHERTSTEWIRHTRVLFDVLPAASDQLRPPDKALLALRRALAEEPRVRTSDAGSSARVAESALGEDAREKDDGARWVPMERVKKKCTPLADHVASRLLGLRDLSIEDDDDAAFGLQLSDLDDLLDSDEEVEGPAESGIELGPELESAELMRLETVLRQGGDDNLAPIVSSDLSELELCNLLRVAARARSLAAGAITALELSLRSNGVATEREIVRQIAAAQKEAEGKNPRELQLKPLADRVGDAFTLDDFDDLLSEADELELESLGMAARREKVEEGSTLWFGTVQSLMAKASDVLAVLSVDTCRYCTKCEDATEFATDGYLSSKMTQPWVFAGFHCENRHPDFFYRDEVPNRIMDALYAAREVEEYRIETEKAQARRDSYAALVQKRREHCAAVTIQTRARGRTLRRRYVLSRKVLIRLQAVTRGRCDRRLVRQHRRALPKVQAHCRRMLVALSYRNISRAPKATKVQALWRGHRTRNRLRRRSCVAAWPAAKVAAVIQWLQAPELSTTEHLPPRIVLRLDTPPAAARWKSDDAAAKITFRRRGDVLMTVGLAREQWCTHRGVLDQAVVFADMITQRLDLFHNLYGEDAERLIGLQQKAGRFLRIPISLPDEDPLVFANLIHFMYGLPVRLSILQTVQFYQCADRYCATSAMEQSFAAITRWAAEGKCCEVYDAGRCAGCRRVARYCWKYIVRLLEYMVADPTSDIGTMSGNSLLSVIQSSDLVVRSEEIILKLVLRWVMVNLQERFHHLAGCMMCIQWSLLPHEVLQAAVTDEVRLAQLLRLGKFAPWHGRNSVTALLGRLRESNAIIRAVDKAFRSEIFENVVELSEKLAEEQHAPEADVARTPETIETAARHYTPLKNVEAEREAVEEHLASDVDSSGTAWYLVAHRWMMSWMDHVNYWNKSLHPGPIDNTALLSDDGALTRSYLKEGVDYDLVCEPVWRKLVDWYGGGPELKRWSYWERLHGYEVEVSPPKLRVGLVVYDAVPREIKTVEASRYCRIGELVDQTCALYGLQRSDIEELAVWEWSSATKHVRWSRRLPRRQIQAIEERTLKDVSLGDGDTVCLKLTAKARDAYSGTIRQQPEEEPETTVSQLPDPTLRRQIEIPPRPTDIAATSLLGEFRHSGAVQEDDSDEEPDDLSELSSTEEEIDSDDEDKEDEDEELDQIDTQGVLQVNPAGQLTAAGKRAQTTRAHIDDDGPSPITTGTEQPMTVSRMLGLVQKELGIQPGEQNIAAAVKHVEEASGIAIEGTLKDRLQNVAMELGVVRVSDPPGGRGGDRHGSTGTTAPQLAKLQSQMDQVLSLLTGQSQREEMQQIVKAVGVYERMAESRREVSQMNANRDARRNALPPRPRAASPLPIKDEDAQPPPEPSSLVDRLLEAKRVKAAAEEAVRSGPPPPPPVSYQPVQEATCVQTAIELLQRALIADKTTNPRNHDSLVVAAASLTRAQKALLKSLEPGNHPVEAKAVLQDKLVHVRKRMARYIKSVSQADLNAAVLFLESELADVVGSPWSRCYAQVVGRSKVIDRMNVLYRFGQGCPSLHVGSLLTAVDTQLFTETCIASDCRTFLFAAVFDGHDGRQCAQFCQSRLWAGFQRQFHISGGDPVVAFQRAFQEVESGFARHFADDPSKLFSAACSTAVFIDSQSNPSRLCVANIGTCRAVHSSGKQVGATQLTPDHSCEELSERLRLRHLHPDALRKDLDKALLGICTHTRALGGLHLKDGRVAALWNSQKFRRVHPLPGTTLTNAIGQERVVSPYMTSRVGVASSSLAEGEFVIIATSAFWRCFDNDEAVLLASRLLAGAYEAGAASVNVARAMVAECNGRCDDDIALLLITADGTTATVHNTRDFDKTLQSSELEPELEPDTDAGATQPPPPPPPLLQPPSQLSAGRGASHQPPPPAAPAAPVSKQTISRLRERRGAVTTTGATGRLMEADSMLEPSMELPVPPRPAPPPLIHQRPPAGSSSGGTAAQSSSSSPLPPIPHDVAKQQGSDDSDDDEEGWQELEARRQQNMRLRARRGAVTTMGTGGAHSAGADGARRTHTRELTQTPTQPQPQTQPQMETQAQTAAEYVHAKREELGPLLMPHRSPAPAPQPAWRPAPPSRTAAAGRSLVQRKRTAAAAAASMKKSGTFKSEPPSPTLAQRMASIAASWEAGKEGQSRPPTDMHRSSATGGGGGLRTLSLKQRMASVVSSWHGRRS